MSQAEAAISKIPTDSPQPPPRRPVKSPGRPKRAPSTGTSPALAGGTGRVATRGGGEVIELDCGITVYPARSEGGRWRAVWQEDGERQQCEAPTEEKLAAKLEKVKVRLEADAPNMRKLGAALIAHYARPHPAPAVPPVRSPGHRHGHVPGRQDQSYAADRQRRPDRKRRRPGPPEDLPRQGHTALSGLSRRHREPGRRARHSPQRTGCASRTSLASPVRAPPRECARPGLLPAPGLPEGLRSVREAGTDEVQQPGGAAFSEFVTLPSRW